MMGTAQIDKDHVIQSTPCSLWKKQAVPIDAPRLEHLRSGQQDTSLFLFFSSRQQKAIPPQPVQHPRSTVAWYETRKRSCYDVCFTSRWVDDQ